MRKIVTLFLAGMASLTFAQQPMGTDFKKLFLQALNSPSGKSRTDVTGPMADSIRLQTNAPNARVVAEVDTLKELPQEGCKRLRLILTTPGMLFETPRGFNAPLRIGVMLNICTDGQPPGDESIVSAKNNSLEKPPLSTIDFSPAINDGESFLSELSYDRSSVPNSVGIRFTGRY